MRENASGAKLFYSISKILCIAILDFQMPRDMCMLLWLLPGRSWPTEAMVQLRHHS